jgi:hypothetical protein
MKALAVSVLALSFCMPAFSQSADTPQTKSDNMKNEKSMSMSMVGCIDEKDGKYMVVNKEHPKGVMLMTSEDMKPHVGHMMKVDGMMMHGDSMSKPDDSTKSAEMAKDGSKSDNMGMMGMKMTGMKMMSKTCDPTK